MTIGDTILQMMGNQDPRLQLLATLQQGGTSGTSQPASGTPAAGAGGAATATPQQPPQPEVYKSPPQLMELYSNMIKMQNRSGMIDNGIGLIASAFARPENRAGIRTALSSGTSASSDGFNDPMKFIEQMMKMQQDQAAIQRQSEHRARLPDIAKQYGLDLNTTQFLFDSGQLDEVLSALVKPDNQVVDLEDGTKVIVNKTTGVIGDPFGPAKKREMEIVEDDRGNKFAVYKDTKERVGAENIVTGQGSTQMEREWRLANEEREKAGNSALSFEDYVHQRGRSGAGASNLGPSGIDYGDPPKDTAWVRESDGSIKVDKDGAPVSIPIVGSELWQERQDADKKDSDRSGQKAVVSSFVDASIGDALGLIKPHKDSWLPGVTGLGGTIGKYIPGSQSMALNDTLETIKANLGFEKLQQMREASPTGGALGQVSDFENRLLQSTFGSLNQSGDDDILVRNLFRIQYMADAIVNGMKSESGVTKFDENKPEEAAKMQKDLFTRADEDAKKWMAQGKDDAPVEEDPAIQELLKKHGVIK